MHDWVAIQQYHDEGHPHRECMAKFGCSRWAWNYAKERGWLVARPKLASAPVEEWLVQAKVSRYHLKNKLLKAGLLKNKCALCNLLPEWNGKPLVMRLDHINGAKDDNRLENLRLVCPNCDSQLDTFAGRNIAVAKARRELAQAV